MLQQRSTLSPTILRINLRIGMKKTLFLLLLFPFWWKALASESPHELFDFDGLQSDSLDEKVINYYQHTLPDFYKIIIDALPINTFTSDQIVSVAQKYTYFEKETQKAKQLLHQLGYRADLQSQHNSGFALFKFMCQGWSDALKPRRIDDVFDKQQDRINTSLAEPLQTISSEFLKLYAKNRMIKKLFRQQAPKKSPYYGRF